jgi:hypothetical protein
MTGKLCFFAPVMRNWPRKPFSPLPKKHRLKNKETNNFFVLLSAIPTLPKNLGNVRHLFNFKSLSFS